MDKDKSIHEKLDLIIENQMKQDNKYLAKIPYVSILAPFRYLYEHPAKAALLFVFIIDGILDLTKKGIVTALITYYFK